MTDGKHPRQVFQLVPLTRSHMAPIASWYEDIGELALIESKLPLPVSVETLENIWRPDFEPRQPRTSYVYSILDEDGGNIGFTGLQDINFNYGNAVVFIFIAKSHRRLGLAVRAMAMMLDFAFNQLRLHRIATYVHATNTPSLGLVERLGFIDEGRLREACYYNGQYDDVNIVGLLDAEWQQVRESLSDSMQSNVILTFGSGIPDEWCWPITQHKDIS